MSEESLKLTYIPSTRARMRFCFCSSLINTCEVILRGKHHVAQVVRY